MNRHTGLTCPITGTEILYVGHEQHVMDGLSFYESADGKVKYSRHPFGWNIFYVGNPYNNTNARAFRLNEDNTFTEVKSAGGVWWMLDTPQEEIDEYIKEKERKHQEWRKSPEGKAWAEVWKGINFIPVKAQPVNMELVDVKPLSPPSGVLTYVEYNYESE